MSLIRGNLKFSDLLPKTYFSEKWTKPTLLKGASDYPKNLCRSEFDHSKSFRMLDGGEVVVKDHPAQILCIEDITQNHKSI